MDEIVIADYNPVWPEMYEQARAELAETLGPYALDIQHVGSTSVPGLAAKPIIDIAVAIQEYPLPDERIQAVVKLGYEFAGEFGIPRRHYFRRGTPRTHHVHIHEIDNDEWRNFLLFRDYIRAHPDEARHYEALKRDLASRYAHDRETYSDSKTPFVRGILNKARAWMPPGEGIS